MDTLPDPIEPNVTAVVVTYGDRGHLVDQVLEHLTGFQNLDVILVNNGPCTITARPKDLQISPIYLPENLGSAAGFARGLAAALQGKGQYILLLDDDNAVAPRAISWLLNHVQVMAQTQDPSLCAAAAFRKGRFRLTPTGFGRAATTAFLGFDARQTAEGLLERLGLSARPSLRRGQGSGAQTDPLPYCAYGGLLAHRSLFERIGLPNEAMVLYADDHEYTHRITVQGGRIDLVRQAVIEDVDFGDDRRKAPRKSGVISQLLGRLRTKPDFRLYYATRNHVWLGVDLNQDHRLAFGLNALAYLSLTTVMAAALGRWKNYKILIRAVSDGFAHRGGLRPEFPLPSLTT